MHPDCGAVLGRCPTLGCTRGVEPAIGTSRKILSGVLVLLAIGLCCVPLANIGSPFEWADELGERAMQPGVAEAARRVMRDRAFVERAEREGGRIGPSSPLWQELPPEVQSLGSIAVTSSWIESSPGGSFGNWGVIIDLEAGHRRPLDENGWRWRKVGPGIWTYVTR